MLYPLLHFSTPLILCLEFLHCMQRHHTFFLQGHTHTLLKTSFEAAPCFAVLSKFKCLAAKHSCLNPLWTYFLVTCPRLDPNDCITARGCAWMSPEETVVVFVQCFYTDVAKSSISNFRWVGTAFSGEQPQARAVFLFDSYSGQIFST